MTRASVVLPEPLEPTMPRVSPGFSAKVTARSCGASVSGNFTETPSTCNRPLGSGRVVRSRSTEAVPANRSVRVFQLATACTRLGQTPTTSSTGATARLSSTEAAMMEPGVMSPFTASQAARPSAADCNTSRRNLIAPE